MSHLQRGSSAQKRAARVVYEVKRAVARGSPRHEHRRYAPVALPRGASRPTRPGRSRWLFADFFIRDTGGAILFVGQLVEPR